MSVKLLTEHDLEFLSLKGGCTGSSESTLVKMPHCWKSHVAAQIPLCPSSSSYCQLKEVLPRFQIGPAGSSDSLSMTEEK